MYIISVIFKVFLDLLFPARCPVCDRPVRPFGAKICAGCTTKVRYNPPPYCMKCGKHLDDETEEYCLDCKKKKHHFDRGFSLFEYKSVSDSLYRFKYAGRREYASYYGDCLALAYGNMLKELGVQAIIPVPIHTSRRRRRGYNQAQEIAVHLGKQIGIPVESRLIKRCKKTLPLKDLTPLERQNNLKKGFKICRNDVKLNTIVILDDIYTTGSTVDELSTILRENGVVRIYVLTLSIGKGI